MEGRARDMFSSLSDLLTLLEKVIFNDVGRMHRQLTIKEAESYCVRIWRKGLR
jgi:hypothetical protein